MAAGYKEQAIELLKTMIEGSDDIAATVEIWATACVQCSKIGEWKAWLADNQPENTEDWLEKVSSENFL